METTKVPDFIQQKVAALAKHIAGLAVEIETLSVVDPEGARALISVLRDAAVAAEESLRD